MSETSGVATKELAIIRYSITLIMQHEACSKMLNFKIVILNSQINFLLLIF